MSRSFDARPELGVSRGSRTFEAEYWGLCPLCDEKIQPGQKVRYTVDDTLVHDSCSTPSVPARPVVVCDRCWLQKPCDCDPP